MALPFSALLSLWRREFAGYNLGKLQKDLLAGLTVAAVGLPLALAFGVASGATAAAGIVTAVLAGLVIGGLGGSPFQISGPTGAMSAVLIVLAARYGLGGVWMAGVLAGLMILLAGVFRLGRFVAYIPSPVISGFTSGIALIIAIGQIDNFLGVKTPAAENTVAKLIGYFTHPVLPDLRSVGLALLVIGAMIVMPRLTSRIPGSLIGIILATLVAVALGWSVPAIGEIPRTILLDERLTPALIPWGDLTSLIVPAASIAALGAIESLLCATVASNMTGIKADNDQELIAQGLGNIIVPFFGGVPATAAIARTSVGIKSDAQTRLTSIIHAVAILLSALVFSPLIARVPLAALAGVLMMTAWRMNEWHAIHFFFGRRLRSAMVGFTLTMLATVALDLTQAILLGVAISAVIFIRQIADIRIERQEVNVERMQAQGHVLETACPLVHVYFVTGPLFFGAASTFQESIETSGLTKVAIMSMRGVPLIDVMGVQALENILERQRAQGGDLYLSGVQPAVRDVLDRTGFSSRLGESHYFWRADEAILAAERRQMGRPCPYCDRAGNECTFREVGHKSEVML
ncbi:MAG: SulP family inorganic anion transporter [Anaerolineae bacterium]|nr:SulP family inorganic anion transporter [Anaerolineae bacterium]